MKTSVEHIKNERSSTANAIKEVTGGEKKNQQIGKREGKW